jgi:hydrophobic/amphiphilic exporter-1 (mainly G- bacteria), HAE1 family
MDYPGIRLDVNRVHAAELGLSQKDVVDNVITALNSNVMIAPNYWVDRKTGNNYFLTVQYYEHGTPSIRDPLDLTNIPIRAPNLKEPTTLDTVVNLARGARPDHGESSRYRGARAACA